MTTPTAPEVKYYTTKKPVLHFTVDREFHILVDFTTEKRFKTDDAEIIAYMDKLLAGRVCPFRAATKEEYEAHYTGPDIRQDKRAEILAAMATSKGGATMDIPKLANPVDSFKATSSADSPLTGGQNPASMQVSQADTIKALKAKATPITADKDIKK